MPRASASRWLQICLEMRGGRARAAERHSATTRAGSSDNARLFACCETLSIRNRRPILYFRRIQD